MFRARLLGSFAHGASFEVCLHSLGCIDSFVFVIMASRVTQSLEFFGTEGMIAMGLNRTVKSLVLMSWVGNAWIIGVCDCQCKLTIVKSVADYPTQWIWDGSVMCSMSLHEHEHELHKVNLLLA